MKKIIYSLLALTLLIGGSCKKKSEEVVPEETPIVVEKVNRAAYFHFSEDWCGPCGAYGGPTFDSCVKTLEGNLITCMKVYQSSNNTALECRLADLMENSSNYNISTIPSLFVNNGLQFGVGSNIGYNFNKVKTPSTTFSTAAVVAGVYLAKSVEGSNMNVTAKVQFFQAATAGKDYRLAVYVLEDNVKSSQVVGAGTVTNYNHRNVWRAGNAADYKGEKLNTAAAIDVDQQFDRTYSIPLLSTWNSANMKVMAVIWDCTSTTAKPLVVNSNVVK